MPAVAERRQSPPPLAGAGGRPERSRDWGQSGLRFGRTCRVGSAGSACAVHPGALQGAPPRAEGPARPQLPVGRWQRRAHGSPRCPGRGRPLGDPPPQPEPRSGTAIVAQPPRELAGARGQARVTHHDLGRDPAPGQAVSGCSRALLHDARQSRGGAGGGLLGTLPPNPWQPRGLPPAPPEPAARGFQARGPPSRAGAGGAVGGGAGGGRGPAGDPTCPGRAGQWAPGVRKDRHIWTCSGAARAAAPRARPAPLK